MVMATPGLGDYFRQVGVIPASREGVSAALSAGCDVIIWPGGEVDAMRNWRRRDEAVLALIGDLHSRPRVIVEADGQRVTNADFALPRSGSITGPVACSWMMTRSS